MKNKLLTSYLLLLTSQSGFGLIETIVAVAIMIIIAATGTTTVLHSFYMNRLGDEETEATLFAQEGIEAIRSIKNQGWDSPFIADAGTYSCSTGCGIDSTGGWLFKSGPDTSGDFARSIVISDVYRTGGDIVEGGDTLDEDVKKVTSTVTWEFSPARSNTVELISYLANWKKTLLISCNWSNPAIVGSFNFPTNNDGIKVQTQGNYVYVVIDDNGNPPYDFAILDVTDPANPVLKGTLEGDGTLWNLAVSGNYVYLASGDNDKELQIIDISNPTSPVARGSYNAPGSRDAMGIYAIGTTVYLVKTGDNANHEFFIINASNPDSPSLVGSADLGNNNRGGLEVYVSGNYAYIASEDQDKELKIVDINNPSSPSYLSSGGYDVSGNRKANTIAGFDTTAVIGVDNNYLYFLNVSNPLDVSLISTYAADDQVNDLAMGENNDSVFEVSNNNVNNEFQIVDISDINNPTSLGSLNTQIRLRGVAFNGDSCAVYAVGAPNVNEPEFLVIAPQ